MHGSPSGIGSPPLVPRYQDAAFLVPRDRGFVAFRAVDRRFSFSSFLVPDATERSTILVPGTADHSSFFGTSYREPVLFRRFCTVKFILLVVRMTVPFSHRIDLNQIWSDSSLGSGDLAVLISSQNTFSTPAHKYHYFTAPGSFMGSIPTFVFPLFYIPTYTSAW